MTAASTIEETAALVNLTGTNLTIYHSMNELLVWHVSV
jgi:hypothetical protein